MNERETEQTPAIKRDSTAKDGTDTVNTVNDGTDTEYRERLPRTIATRELSRAIATRRAEIERI